MMELTPQEPREGASRWIDLEEIREIRTGTLVSLIFSSCPLKCCG